MTAPGSESRLSGRRWQVPPDVGSAVLLATVAIGVRLLVNFRFPTIPISDFRSLVAWGLQMRDAGLAAPGWHWAYFNPGLPALLSALFRLFPADPDAVARTATAVVTGAVCLVPFLGWRGVFSLRVRLVAGGLLAVWPGQVLFSTVIAQDNWVLLPFTGLAVLAVRVLRAPAGAAPVLAALLWAASVAIRQEMVLVALPLAAVSAGLRTGRRIRWNAVLRLLVASLLSLSVLGGLRARATGRFSLSTGHGAKSLLGSWVPGAVEGGWADPLPFVASEEPDLLRDESRLSRGAVRLAARQALRRPLFHAARVAGQLTRALRSGESGSLIWSLWREDVLPPSSPPPRDAVLITRAIDAWQGVLHVVFAAVFLVAFRRRDGAVLLLVTPIALKVLVHLVVAIQGRYFFPVTALEILAVSVGLGALQGPRDWKRFAAVLAGSAVLLGALAAVGTRALAAAMERDTDVSRSYRFTLRVTKGKASLDCGLEHARLQELYSDGGRMRLEKPDPAPAEEAVLECRVVPEEEGRRMVAFEAMDEYAQGALPGRLFQAASLSGTEVFVHDVAAEAGTGWHTVVLPFSTRDTLRFVLRAGRPDPGCNWGQASSTPFRLRAIP